MQSCDQPSPIRSSDQGLNLSNDSGNTHDMFASKNNRMFIDEKPSLPLKKKIGFHHNESLNSFNIQDKKGFFARKAPKKPKAYPNLRGPQSMEQNVMGLYETNKTQKQVIGRESVFDNMKNPKKTKISTRHFISKEDVDETLNSVDSSRNNQFKSKPLRRSVQSGIKKKGYSINFGQKSHQKNINLESQNFEKDLRKIGDSKRDALDALSNYSSMTSDIQKKIKFKLQNKR